MKLFIWTQISDVTHSYHSEASLVVIAEDLNAAKLLAVANDDVNHELELPDPDFTYDLAGEQKPTVHVFPDSGCC